MYFFLCLLEIHRFVQQFVMWDLQNSGICSLTLGSSWLLSLDSSYSAISLYFLWESYYPHPALVFPTCGCSGSLPHHVSSVCLSWDHCYWTLKVTDSFFSVIKSSKGILIFWELLLVFPLFLFHFSCNSLFIMISYLSHWIPDVFIYQLSKMLIVPTGTISESGSVESFLTEWQTWCVQSNYIMFTLENGHVLPVMLLFGDYVCCYFHYATGFKFFQWWLLPSADSILGSTGRFFFKSHPKLLEISACPHHGEDLYYFPTSSVIDWYSLLFNARLTGGTGRLC